MDPQMAPQCAACVGSLVTSKLSGRYGIILKIEKFIDYKYAAKITKHNVKYKTVMAYYIHWFDQVSNIIAKISGGWLYRIEFNIVSN